MCRMCEIGEHTNLWTILTIGILIILSTMTKMVGLPHSLSLTQIMSKSATMYVRIIVIVVLLAYLLYPLLSKILSSNFEPYADKATISANSMNPEMGLSTPTDQYDSNPGDTNYLNQFAAPAASAAFQSWKNKQNFDVSLNLVDPDPIYYQPGSFMIGGVGFVPNYEQGIAMSKLTGIPQAMPIQNAPYLNGGFCQDLAGRPIDLELKCNSLHQDLCASTECCVLLGGQKCVSGNSNGPSVKANYSDFTILNKDFYYYKGKCHGNCPN